MSALLDAQNTAVLPTLLMGILTVDTVTLAIARYFPDFLGATLNEWYDRFTLSAVLADTFIIFIGFLLARYVYTRYLQPRLGTNLPVFLAVLVVIQLLHDLLFYAAVIQPMPEGHNAMIDVFRRYAQAGPIILFGDAILMLASAVVTLVYLRQPSHVVWSAGALVSYALPYLLYTKWK
jgi:hypothetical protein